MEEGVIDKKCDSQGKNDEGKEAECLDDTHPAEIEESVDDRNDDKNNEIDEGK